MGTCAKGREQRLHRFLENPRLTPEILIPLHAALVLGIQASGSVPLIMDQTTIRGIQTLLVGAVFEGRVLPVAFSCFTYHQIRKSENILEQSLLVTVTSCSLPKAVRFSSRTEAMPAWLCSKNCSKLASLPGAG